MKLRFGTLIFGLLAAFACATGGAALAQDEPKRAITKIAGDLYRFQNNFHYSVFLVTPDGVIATDPINAGAAKWLKNKIKEQFNLPIKYLILSHDHADHSSGGEPVRAMPRSTSSMMARRPSRAASVRKCSGESAKR